MNLYDDSSNNNGLNSISSAGDNYSQSIQNNVNSMTLSNNIRDLSNLSRAKKRRIVYLNLKFFIKHLLY